MDPQGRFTNEYQALRYVRDYTDELAAAYGKTDEPSREQAGKLLTVLQNVLAALGKHFKPEQEINLTDRDHVTN